MPLRCAQRLVHRLVCSETPACVHPDRVVEPVTQNTLPSKSSNTVHVSGLTTDTPLLLANKPGRRATTKANGITVRSPIGSSKNAVNLGGKDEPGLNGASSCVPAGGLR